MILRTDTIGHYEKPSENNIRKAISYANADFFENDIVKLIMRDGYYLAILIGKKENGHILAFRHGEKISVECDKKLTSETAIQIMIRYLHGDMSWFKEYRWNQSTGQEFIEATEFLIKMESEQGRF